MTARVELVCMADIEERRPEPGRVDRIIRDARKVIQTIAASGASSVVLQPSLRLNSKGSAVLTYTYAGRKERVTQPSGEDARKLRRFLILGCALRGIAMASAGGRIPSGWYRYPWEDDPADLLDQLTA